MSESNKMMKCKTCGEDIAKSAKVCPKCGAKNKQPFYKKKRFYALVLVLVVIIGLFGYIKLQPKYEATVITPAGEVEQLTASELCTIDKDNQAKFEKVYSGSSVEVTSKVESITTNMTNSMFNFGFTLDEIDLEGGWKVLVKHGEYDLSELQVGDTLNVKSKLLLAFVGHVFLYSSNTDISK